MTNPETPGIFSHCAFYIYGSKLGAHYRPTLFADLNLEITSECTPYANRKEDEQGTVLLNFTIIIFACA